MPTVRLSEETYTNVMRLLGFLRMRDGVAYSVSDLIDDMIEQYEPDPIDMEEDDMFKIKNEKKPAKDSLNH